MLFEAMPLSLRSEKRKTTHSHCHEDLPDLPLSKKITLEHQAVAKYTQSKPSLLSFTTSSSLLPESPVSSSSDESALSLKNSDISLHLGTSKIRYTQQRAEAKYENGMSSEQLSENDEDSLRLPEVLRQNHSQGDCSPHGQNISSPDSPAEHSLCQPSLVNNKKSKEKHKSQDQMILMSNQKKALAKSVLEGGYMRRMASLNASACVTALIEPEKKVRPHKNLLSNSPSYASKDGRQGKESRQSWSLSSSEDLTPVVPVENMKDHQRVKDLSLSPAGFYGSSASSSEADTSKDSDEIVPHVLLALATSLARNSTCDLDEIPYNKLGLLYNGDTIHPAARVFYNSDLDLTLPERIISRVVPSRDKFVSSAIKEALSQRLAGKKRKGAKANNGWTPLGNSIKSIEYKKGSNLVVRRYYAGIRRSHGKEVIFIRDSVLIRSGDATLNGLKPYVAKIASIWQEQPGHLMMTVFWYYRPYELEGVATQGISFQEDELLASQHNDDNSVACIEEKCYVLGATQYNRYKAFIKSRKENRISPLCRIVPPSLKMAGNEACELSVGSWSSGVPEQSHIGLEPSKAVEPGLVYLCHRGYNHSAAKLVSKSGLR